MFEVQSKQGLFFFWENMLLLIFCRSEQLFFCYIVLISFMFRSLILILSAVSGFYVFV